MTIDQDARRVLELIRLTGRPPLETLSPEQARAVYAASRTVMQLEPEAVAEVVALAADGPHGPIPLRLYRPRGAAADAVLPALVFYHGGGWVIGDLESHDTVCRSLANASGGIVVAVDYRLAPEHPFPAAVDDSIAATRFVQDQAEALRIDPQRIAVGGDSAGGNLAAVVCLAARDGALAPPCLQVLIYPATDLTATSPSYDTVTEGLPLTATTARWFMAHYLARREDALDWRASPIRAADLSNLPPAFVVTCAHDPLCDEGRAYAERLEREGGIVALLHLSDQIHGFLTMARVIRASSYLIAVTAMRLRLAWTEAPR